MTNGVDVAKDVTVHFSDSSYQYDPDEYLNDILEGRPHGRLLSLNPTTGETIVLLRDLYHSNGVAVTPDHSSLVFCEIPIKRSRTYWLQGSKKSSIEAFVLAIPSARPTHFFFIYGGWQSISSLVDRVMKDRVLRKIMAIMARYIGLGSVQKNGGIFVVDLEGNPTAHYYDPALSLISSGIKVENQLYSGSLQHSHIIRFNLSST
ncbi:hypothetical protein Cgig2_024782 [Carnegiea gigantea]|uniref:Strictosidine synthase conserved region domain-containing protein n=1 Tax=Carnegiea gigantea TaxID=171969 RepID=A0A9Q1K2W9_9CARY|nr:hypothetical protein Cgig2_024782 [Carnegiea gigantea]